MQSNMLQVLCSPLQSDGRPIKDEAHELQVESWRKTVQSDPSGGSLFTLTAFTEVAVLSIQLLLLRRWTTI